MTHENTTMKQAFDTYIKSVYTEYESMDAEQLKQLQMAFYGGAMICSTITAAVSSLPEDQAVEKLRELHDELHEFGENL